MFEQHCLRGHLPLNPETVMIENKPVKAAKRQYKNKVEEQFNTNTGRSM